MSLARHMGDFRRIISENVRALVFHLRRNLTAVVSPLAGIPAGKKAMGFGLTLSISNAETGDFCAVGNLRRTSQPADYRKPGASHRFRECEFGIMTWRLVATITEHKASILFYPGNAVRVGKYLVLRKEKIANRHDVETLVMRGAPR